MITRRVALSVLILSLATSCTHQVHLGVFHGSPVDPGPRTFALSLAEPAVHDTFRLSVDGHHYEFSNVYTDIAQAFRFKTQGAPIEVFGTSPDGVRADVYLYPEIDFSFEQTFLQKTCIVRFRLTAKSASGEVLAREYLQGTETFAQAAAGGYACSAALRQVFPEVVEPVLGALR